MITFDVSTSKQTLAAARMLTSTGPVGQTHWGDSTANNSSSGTQSADAQLKVIDSLHTIYTFLFVFEVIVSYVYIVAFIFFCLSNLRLR